MERTDELKERIRQQPLNDRLEESRRRIGDMCSKGRCPKMTIPVQHDDDDFYINTTLADAQATIAALQARVQELEQWVQDQSTANLETMRHTDEMQSRALEAEQQLTQRTAELAQILAAVDEGLALTDIRLAIKTVEETQAELERVRGLVKTYAAAKIDFDDKRLQEDHHAWRERYNKLVEAENALLQHRQGMEG